MRLENTIGLFATSICGMLLALCPVCVYETWLDIFALIYGGAGSSPLSPFWGTLALLAFLTTPVLAVDAYRGARVLGNRNVPFVLTAGLVIILASPFLLTPAVREFGLLAHIVLWIWWPIGSLSPAAFCIACAQIDAERRNEKVRTTTLNVLYQLGGFVGVALASRMFPESKALEKFPSGVPGLVLGIAAIAGVSLLFSVLFGDPIVPGGAPVTWPWQ
jgi:hypothetical protein